MGVAEAPIQRYVTDRLTLLERTKPVYFFRSNSFSGRVTRWDGSQGYVKNSKRGMPDIIALVNGKFCGFELKSANGRLSPEQKLTAQTIESCGGFYFIIKTPEDFEAAIESLL